MTVGSAHTLGAPLSPAPLSSVTCARSTASARVPRLRRGTAQALALRQPHARGRRADSGEEATRLSSMLRSFGSVVMAGVVSASEQRLVDDDDLFAPEPEPEKKDCPITSDCWKLTIPGA